ncbi:T-complex protein 1 subunit theta [Tetrabaena socialis]|uniref:T-complex protein 1 subunit theta n=1 Tax=Tetrabaena socialis TaxID=47790 RepID=A0A2J7ZJZ1_9CHLO|nr:T-complex protein 1 subunit theta [Tetrabaena socialis]|eukprot:PNH00570.1 T-complex protein 1 subunit theta [Tetrabaena socialis]
MATGMPYGLQAMLKDGHKHFSGLQEAVMKNIEACKGLAQITRTSLGPNGMNKMVINHLERLFVTSDASTIVSELEVQHPAAKLLVMAAKAQEAEIGDGTNLVLTLGGELLANAESLLRDGLHTAEVVEGYQRASEKALEILDSLVLPDTVDVDVRDKAAVGERRVARAGVGERGRVDGAQRLHVHRVGGHDVAVVDALAQRRLLRGRPAGGGERGGGDAGRQ